MADECATCGDPQSQHKGGKGGCRHCEFGCGEYVPEVLVERVAPVPAEELVPDEEVSLPSMGTEVGKVTITPVRPTPHLDAVKKQLAEVERELGLMRASNTALGVDLDLMRAELTKATRERDDARGEAARLQDALDKAAGDRDEYRQGRDEAIGRALELAAEVERLRGEVEKLGTLDPGSIDELLDQADATESPAIVRTSTSIRDLLTDLREQLAEHDRHEGLRAELAQLDERRAAILAELADAEQPPAPVIPDKVIREWAKANGRAVDARGRVSMELRALYLRANPA